MFSFIKNSLQKIYTGLTSKLTSLFSRATIDEKTLHELEILLIGADTGVKTTRHIIENLKKEYAGGNITQGEALKSFLGKELGQILKKPETSLYKAPIYLLVGINGSGKTTFCGKLAQMSQKQAKKVLLVAADTFRAAATEQLATWAGRLGVDIVTGKENQDPASVVYAGCQRMEQGSYDTMIIDTAGRLQTKANLMKELEKIKRTISKLMPEKQIVTLLTIDGMLGQNSFEQAKLFHESTQLDGIVLTKMDGTGKGGIVFAIAQELGIPILFLSFGENLEQCKPFDADEYVSNLINS